MGINQHCFGEHTRTERPVAPSVVEKEAQGESVASSRKYVASSKGRRPAGKSDAAARAALLADDRYFCPESLAYLKDVFGVDLSVPESKGGVPLRSVYDIAKRRVTEDPIDLVIKPLSKVDDDYYEMDPIKTVACVKFVLPYNRTTYKPIPPSEDAPVMVETYPCYPYVMEGEPVAPLFLQSPKAAASDGEQLSESSEEGGLDTGAEMEPAEVSEDGSSKECVVMTEAQRQLVGVFCNLIQCMKDDKKRDVLAGKPFDVNGSVRVDDGFKDLYVRVNGVGQIKTNRDGVMYMDFRPVYPMKREKGMLPDVVNIRRVGNVTLDFFERYPGNNRIRTDVNHVPVLNQAGRDLVNHGVCFEPVRGRKDNRVYNPEIGKYVTKSTYGFYQVTLVNGGLCVTEMDMVEDLDQKTGAPLGTTHPELHMPFIAPDGRLNFEHQILEPANPIEAEKYRRGYGGIYKDFKFVDYKRGKKEYVYDAIVYADNRRNGFPHACDPQTSQEIIERRLKGREARKQRFHM